MLADFSGPSKSSLKKPRPISPPRRPRPASTPTYTAAPYNTTSTPTYHTAAPAAVGHSTRAVSPYRDKHVGFLTGFREIGSPIQGLDPSMFTSTYGPRINPVTHRASFHTGMDLASPMGTPVLAAANGVVGQVNPMDSIYGNQIYLEHGHNKETMYGHMAQFADGIHPGERVKEGQIIGYVGSTGWSTGPHLHFETHVKGQPVNPITFLGGGNSQGSEPPSKPPTPIVAQKPHRSMSQPSGPMVLNSQTAQFFEQPAPGAGSHAGVNPNLPSERLQNPQLEAFLSAITQQESGGNYGAVGTPTRYGTALGKYQVLDSNIAGPGGWDQEALGYNISPVEYLRSPSLQDAIARDKLSEYFRQYGPAGAAKAWYAGPGAADSMSTAPQYGGPSIVSYANQVMQRMNQYLG